MGQLDFHGSGVHRPFRCLLGNGRRNVGMGVAVDERGEVVQEVEVLVAIDIEKATVLAPFGKDGVREEKCSCPGVPAGQRPERPFIKCSRTRSALSVPRVELLLYCQNSHLTTSLPASSSKFPVPCPQSPVPGPQSLTSPRVL